MKDESQASTHLFGVGLDNTDGHTRITRAKQFSIVGGSQETHDRMTETVTKTFETLDRRRKKIEDVEKEELADIIRENTPK